jgi:hypothetical protein
MDRPRFGTVGYVDQPDGSGRMNPMLDLFDELRSAVGQMDQAGIPYALCGGLAMAVHGFPRATVDIDLLVLPEDLGRVEAAVAPLGYTIPAPPMTFRGGAVEIRRLSKVHASGRLLSLDFLLVTPAIHSAWTTRQSMQWDFGTLTVVSRDGLIALKSLLASGRDRDDIAQLQGNSE